MIQMPHVQYDMVALAGGLDLVTPTLNLKPGVCRSAQNFEASVNGGYTRIAGYERFDGRASPAAATYSIFSCTLTASVSAGATITGAVSGSTAMVIAVGVAFLAVTQVSAPFTAGEGLTVGGLPVGTYTDANGTPADSRTGAVYGASAADVYRALIGAVPGSGAIHGVAYYNGTVYAFRDNAAGTACDLYKSSASGWQKVNFGLELSFNAGVVQISDGTTITNGTGATATVARVVLESGSWGSTAAGRLILSSSTGTWANLDAIKVGATTCATALGAASQITQLPGGRYEIIEANFGGSANTVKLYGCDGVNRGFEFDGTTFVPIRTGMTTDIPKHVIAHKNYLFFSFAGSLQFCGLGTPYAWTVILGAGELALGANITGLLVQPGTQSGGALAIYTGDNTFILYGSSSADFKLVTFNTGTGALDYTVQNMLSSYVMDNRGVLNMQTTLNYGNFDVATMTHSIRTFIAEHRTRVCESSINREKSQYRVFFSDGYGLYITIVNDQLMGSMPVLFPDPVLCMAEGVNALGQEVAFFGTSSGYVHQLDTGTSFDGATIPASLALVFNTERSPRIRKRYRKASLEVTGNSYAEISFGYDLGYASSDIAPVADKAYASAFSPTYWDNFYWDNFYWDGRTLAPTECEMTGTAENIAIRLGSNVNFSLPFTINSLILHYTLRRGLR